MTELRIILAAVILAGMMTGQPLLAQQEAMDQRLAEAEHVYRRDGAETALPVFEALLQVFQQNDEARNAALAEGYIGECHWRLGHFDEARNALDHALAAKLELGDRLQQGKTLNVLGLLEWDLGNFEAAIGRFQEASAIGQELGDRKLQGATLNNLSMVLDELGDYRKSLQQYQRALDIYQGVDFPRGEGDTLGNIGGVYLLLGHYSEAVEYYQKALRISEQLESVPSMSQDHGNLGLCYTGLGRIDEALAHFDTALSLAEQAGMRQEQAFWLRGKANALIKEGRYDLALQSHRAALDILAEANARPLLLEAQHDLGQLYLELGDPTTAGQYFQAALELARSVESSRGITVNLMALGDLQYFHERYKAAGALYSQAAQRCSETGEHGIHTEALLRLAIVHSKQGAFEQARQEAREALEIARETGALATEATALFTTAELDRQQGQVNSALAGYAEAGKRSAAVGDPDLMWQIEYGRALALVQDDRRQEAVAALLKAVEYIESVRNRLREKRFRAGYLQDKHQVYIDLVRLQLELGQKIEAFFNAERLRAWSYEEQLGNRSTMSLSPAQQSTDIELRERIRNLQHLLKEESNLPRAVRRQHAVSTFSKELMDAEQRYQSFLDDIGNPAAGTPGSAPPVEQDRIRRSLQDGEALIEYVVGAENVMVFVLTADGLQATSTALSRANLRARLELLRDLLLQVDNERWRKPAARLSMSLLEPLQKQGWLEGVTHLYVVPHGMLNYLPFALLPTDPQTGGHSVIENFTLTYLPSASILQNGELVAREIQSLLVVTPASSRLRYVADESSAITELFQPRVLPLAGESATESAFKKIAGNYQVLHLATHGYFNKLNPLFSGLELEADETNDGMLEVYEILGMNLDADLVTLSACETGLGSGYFSEIPAGDDFVGLTRAFLKAGSRSVLATLWPVDDRSTVDLMMNFYQRLEEPGVGRDMAVALANAQRQLRASGKYAHPYYWAPFMLLGTTHAAHGARG